MKCYFDQNFKNYQTTSNNSHSCRLQCTNGPKRVRIVNFEHDEFTCHFTPKITITYSSYETPDKHSENSSANDDRNMNMVPNENTLQGLSNGSNPNLLSAAVIEKISINTTKPLVQCHIENYKNPENSSKILSGSFLPQPILTDLETAENGGHDSLRGNDSTQGCNIVSKTFTTITSNIAHDTNKAFRKIKML